MEEALVPTKGPRAGLHIYCPHKPWPKQQAFLDIQQKEAFFGGAAGGGKSDVLLMAALQYVHRPKYSALILRRDFKRLSLPNSIMDRAKEWLSNTDAKWNAQERYFSFPSGAVLQFGYIDNPDDRFRYASSEYQFIGWDELTEFRLSDNDSNPYQFMFSRLRRTKDNPVPLIVRSASNPGNIGHQWVRQRFISDEARKALKRGEDGIFLDNGKAFVPSLIKDNPAIDEEEYRDSLSHMYAVTRERLMNGDWDIQEDSILKAEWLRDYKMNGDIIVPLRKDGTALPQINFHECNRFATIDTAGTEKDKAKEKRGKPPAWSVVQVWDYWHEHKFLFLRDIWRQRTGWDGLKSGIPKFLDKWNVLETIIEDAHWGGPLRAELGQKYGAKLISTQGKSKLVRSTPLQDMLREGKMFLPQANNSWRLDLEGEWLSWSAHPDEPADQIDTAAYAAIHVKKGVSSSMPWGFASSGRSGVAKSW